ncbi:hypothetical protein ACLS0R_17230 [Comamonas jiangduensis]|uniref:hypothetical protein n=1 Tax=Comamonas jiangduensis TaxID=1194168 RepID=UPI003BF7E002
MSKRHPWLPPEIEALRKLYPDHSANFVPHVLGRDAGSIYPLGLEESDGFWQRDASGRAQKSKQDPRMQSTQFRKGRTPEVSRNYLPIGRACASSKIDGLRERLQMTTRCKSIAGS